MDTEYVISEYQKEVHNEVVHYLSQKKFWKSIRYSAERLDQTLKQRYQTESYKMFICRDNRGQIVGTLGLYLWNTLPYYSLNYFTCEQGNKLTAFKKINNLLWSHVIGEMERLRRHSFYWCIRDYPLADLTKLKSGPQIVSFVPVLERYLFNIEAVVKAGEETPFQFYKNFIRGRTSNVNYVIKRGTLKPEYFGDLG